MSFILGRDYIKIVNFYVLYWVIFYFFEFVSWDDCVNSLVKVFFLWLLNDKWW